MDADKLEEWMLKNNVDPYDPSNVELMERMEEIRRRMLEPESHRRSSSAGITVATATAATATAHDGQCFRLDDFHDQLSLASEAEITANVRFQMLQLRKKKVAEFRSMRMIPINEKEIPRSVLDARKK